MPTAQLYDALFEYLNDWSEASDLRHLKALAWMVVGLLLSQTVSLTAWEPYVLAYARKAQSYQRRWSRFLKNPKIDVQELYLPLVMQAMKGWQKQKLYLAMDTTMLWNEYCMIHLSVVCCGRAVPLLWKVLEHKSATVAFEEYRPMLEQAQSLLSEFGDVTLLADRGFPCHDLLEWLQQRPWHWCLRIPKDTLVHGPFRRGSCTIDFLKPQRGEAKLYHNVRLWEDASIACNLVLAMPIGLEEEEAWAIITDEAPSLETLWRYGKRFCCEEMFLDSKSSVFEFEGSKIRDAQSLSRLYLVLAIALLYATQQGLAVQLEGLRSQVDPHWRRGLSYLKIGLRWLNGVLAKGRKLLPLVSLPVADPEPCFASAQAQANLEKQLYFERVRTFQCLCN